MVPLHTSSEVDRSLNPTYKGLGILPTDWLPALPMTRVSAELALRVRMEQKREKREIIIAEKAAEKEALQVIARAARQKRKMKLEFETRRREEKEAREAMMVTEREERALEKIEKDAEDAVVAELEAKRARNQEAIDNALGNSSPRAYGGGNMSPSAAARALKEATGLSIDL